MRPIDADELRNKVDNYDFSEYSDYSNMIDMIDDAPTIEAEPVNHSKWIPIDHTNDAFCENCGCERGSKAWNKDDFNFCQNSGARMDGDTNEEP